MQPTPEIVDWTTLEVPRAEAEIPQELVDQELDALRQTVAELVPADDRPAREGDTVVVDLLSASGEAQSDTVVELGSGRLVEEIEAALVGASVGETKEVAYDLADESGASVTITVKHVNEKVLPEIDDELARSASEFDTIADLRADIEGRVRAAIEEEIDTAFRAAAVDALVQASNVVPPALSSRRVPGSCWTASFDHWADAGSRPRPTSRSRVSRRRRWSRRCRRRQRSPSHESSCSRQWRTRPASRSPTTTSRR